MPYPPVEPSVWEQWTPEGCATIALRFRHEGEPDFGSEHTGHHHWCEVRARIAESRRRLLAQVADVYGQDGLVLVWRLADGELNAVSQGLIYGALGILANPDPTENALLPPTPDPAQ